MKDYLELTAGSSQYDVAASAGATLQFCVLNVVAGTALACSTAGPNNGEDVQLFTRFGALPDIDVASTIDACVSADGGPNQNCSPYPASVDTYLAISLYTTTGFQGLSLACIKPPVLLKNNVASSPFSATQGETIVYKLESVRFMQADGQ